MENVKLDSKRTNDTWEYSNFFIRIILYLLFYGAIIAMVVIVSNKAYEFAYQIYGDVAVSSKTSVSKDIQIEVGESSMGIASKLYKEGLIVNKYSFFIRLKLSQEVVQPGKYKLSNSMTYSEIINNITISDDAENN